LAAELAEAAKSFAAVAKHPRAADADIFLKAVRYALEFDEWYRQDAGGWDEEGLRLAERGQDAHLRTSAQRDALDERQRLEDPRLLLPD